MVNTYGQLDIVKNRQINFRALATNPTPALVHTHAFYLMLMNVIWDFLKIYIMGIGLILWLCEQCRHAGPSAQHLQFNTL